MTRKNQKSVSFYLSKEEKKALDQIRGKLSYREYVLRGVVNPRKIGRPSLDAATKDLEAQYKQHAEDRQRVIHDQLVKANAKGLPEHVRRRIYGDVEWYKVTCANCKNKYQTSMLMSTCPVCSQVNRYRLPPTELPLGEPTILNRFEFGPDPSVEESTKGNLSEGYNPYYNPASNFELMQGGVADRAVTGEDHSRFKFGKKKKADG